MVLPHSSTQKYLFTLGGQFAAARGGQYDRLLHLINMESSDESSIAQKTWNYVNGFLIYADWDAIGAKDAIWGAAGGFSGGFWGVLGGALGGSVDELYNQTNSSGGVIIIWNGWLVYP